MLSKLSAVQKTVNLLWVAYLSYMSIYLDSGGTMKCAHVDTAVDSNNAKLSEETWQKLDRNILGEVKTPITDQLLDYLVKKGVKLLASQYS